MNPLHLVQDGPTLLTSCILWPLRLGTQEYSGAEPSTYTSSFHHSAQPVMFMCYPFPSHHLLHFRKFGDVWYPTACN